MTQWRSQKTSKTGFKSNFNNILQKSRCFFLDLTTKISLLALMQSFYRQMPCIWLKITQMKIKLLIKTRQVNFTWVKSKDLPFEVQIPQTKPTPTIPNYPFKAEHSSQFSYHFVVLNKPLQLYALDKHLHFPPYN